MVIGGDIGISGDIVIRGDTGISQEGQYCRRNLIYPGYLVTIKRKAKLSLFTQWRHIKAVAM
jgi:hypothetical protein